MKLFLLGLAVALTLGISTATAQQTDFVVKRADDLVWQTSEEFAGIEFALIEGNPAEPGIYVIRARFSPGAWSRPHFHSTDRLVTVVEGFWHAGTDASFDKAATVPLSPGDFMKHPAGAVHYDGAMDVTAIVEISGMGPVESTLVEID